MDYTLSFTVSSLYTKFEETEYTKTEPLAPFSEIIYIKINPYLADMDGKSADVAAITVIEETIISTDDGIKSRAPNIAYDSLNNRLFVAWFDGERSWEWDSSEKKYLSTIDLQSRVFDLNITPVTPETPLFADKLSIDTDWGKPEIAVDLNGNAGIVYCTTAIVGEFDTRGIYYTMIGVTDGKLTTLIDDTRITAQDGHASVRPQLALDSQNMVYVIWHDRRFVDEGTGNHELFLSKLNPYLDDRNGSPADPAVICVISDKEITPNDGFKSYLKGIAVDELERVHVTWADQRDRDQSWESNEIYYKMLDSSAVNLTSDRRITWSGKDYYPAGWWYSSGRNPHIAAFGGRAYITFNVYDDYNDSSDIHLAILEVGSSLTITSFSPSSGSPDDYITILGTNFTGATSVKFGGTEAASFTVDSFTRITAKVGNGSTGKVVVTTPEGTATSTDDFTFYGLPTISGFSPVSGGEGTSVTITGGNLAGATHVKFGGTDAASFTVDFRYPDNR